MSTRDAKSLDAKGIAIVALLVVIFLVVRYWHQILWSAG
jgi:hypothetical protein